MQEFLELNEQNEQKPALQSRPWIWKKLWEAGKKWELQFTLYNVSHDLPLTCKDIIPYSCHNTSHNYSKGKQGPKQWKDERMVHFGIYWEIELFLLEEALSSNRNLSAFWQEVAEWFMLFTIQCFSYLIIHWST